MEKNIHKEDNMRIMNGNQELIDIINVLRASVQAKDREYKKKKNELEDSLKKVKQELENIEN